MDSICGGGRGRIRLGLGRWNREISRWRAGKGAVGGGKSEE